MLAGGGQGVVAERRDHDVEIWPARKASRLGIVVGALHVLDAGRDRDRAAQVRAWPGQRRELRQRVERQVDLRRRAPIAKTAQVAHEAVRQHRRIENPGEGQMGIQAGRHDARRDLLAVLEPHAHGAVAREQDLGDGRVGADLDPGLARSRGDGLGDGAGAAAGQPPRAELAVDLTHVVVQQHVGRARRAHAEKRADDARSRHGGLQHVGLEPLVQEVGCAHRHQLHEQPLQPRRQRAEPPVDREQFPGRAQIRRKRVDRHHPQDRLDETRHLGHGVVVLVVHGRVARRVARDLTFGLLVIVGAPQIVRRRPSA